MSEFQKAFEIIGDLIKYRWVPEILRSIKSGHTNYTEILDSIEYLSHTELQRKLKILSEYDCVVKMQKENRTIYMLTEFGDEMDHIFNHFYQVGQKYLRI